MKLSSKEDARLAISCMHHKKIGYKRLSVNIAHSNANSSSSTDYNSTSNLHKSKIINLFKSIDNNNLHNSIENNSEMPLTQFIQMYEQRYNQTITLSELFKLKDVIYITQSRDGQGTNKAAITK